jgi:hypothetical protein
VKNLFLILTLIFSIQIAFSQKELQVRKVDEFGKLPCCDLSSRTDSLFNEIMATNSKAKGYVVIYSNGKNIQEALRIERLILGEIKFHNFDENRIFIVRRNANEDFKIEYWVDERGETPPFATESEWDFSNLYSLKPKLFYSTFYAGESICETFGEKKHFAEILTANPTAKGHLVIFESSRKRFLKKRNELLGEVSTQFNVPQKQLRTFFIKVPKDALSYHEFWFVPKRSKS